MDIDITRSGEALARCRRSGESLPELPGGLPHDLPTAVALQAAAIAAYDSPQVGFKIGATSPGAQSMLGTSHPFSGPLFASDLHPDGSELAEPRAGIGGIEAEFAFRLGTDLPPSGQPYTLDDVRAAVAAVHPAIEVVGLRLPAKLAAELFVVIADFGANVGFVPGPAHADWEGHDLGAVGVTVIIDGAEVASGTGANVLGNPLNALLWLANDRRDSDGLAAGDWVSTGACTGVVPIASGQTAIADFGPLGSVRLTIRV